MKKGFEFKSIPNKCCGECIKTKCVVGNKLYEFGEKWWNDNDNCTTFECDISDGQIVIKSNKKACPDISQCPLGERMSDGCCDYCQQSASLKNCLAESLSEIKTIGLIQVQMAEHGNCKNLVGVRGITECTGSCKSGTKFDPCKYLNISLLNKFNPFFCIVTFYQLKECECCSVSGTRELPVELVCDDGFKFIKHVNVPADCKCNACEGATDKILKLARASF